MILLKGGKGLNDHKIRSFIQKDFSNVPKMRNSSDDETMNTSTSNIFSLANKKTATKQTRQRRTNETTPDIECDRCNTHTGT